MKLCDTEILDAEKWNRAGFELPAFDRQAMIKRTKENPAWIHFGSGNLFRAYPAALQQTLLNSGKTDTGIIAVGGYDFEVIEKAFRPFDDLAVLVTLKGDGTTEKKVIASVAESLIADPAGRDWERLKSIFAKPSLQMASFTITEKGYALTGADGALMADAAYDMANGSAAPRSTMGKVAALCHTRYKNGAAPIALVSMDNCSHNGTKLYESVHALTLAWAKAGLVEPGFPAYIENPSLVSFPWSMIDKITPRPDPSVETLLKDAGLENTGIIVTAHNSWTAPFVNAEETGYLVIEDSFPNGRPPLEEAGVIFTEAATVDKIEKMKVCTCLNPLHTALAVFGCLLGYGLIHREMRDAQLKALIEKIGYAEGLPVVVDPLIINPAEFIRVVIEKRFPNPFMPDSPQRIATDTSQKLPVRFGETVKAYLARADLSVDSLVGIPLVFAGWCRYLMGIDDGGTPYVPSPDPRLVHSQAFVSGIALGDEGPFHEKLEGLLSDASIFGVDLYKAGLGTRVEKYFTELVSGKGAVRKTLIKYLG